MRVALVSGPDPGHLLPCAGLAVRLQATGHDVVLATGGRWSAALRRAGVAFAELPRLGAAAAGEGFGDRLSTRAADMARPLAETLRAFDPHVVVSDTLTRAGALAAGELGIPWVELIPHNLPDASVALPPFGTGWAPKPLRDRLFRSLHARSVTAGERAQAAARAAARLTLAPAARRLVATLPALEPARPDWPADTSVVGPLTWDPAEGLLAAPAGGGALVLAVGPTASGTGDDLLTMCVSELGSAGIRLVSPRFAPYRATLPTWASAGPGRLAPLLAAADVVVSTGGHGMAVAALSAGVPLVLVPGAGDQKEVAARLVRLGAGVAASPRTLRVRVAEVLTNHSYALRARELGRIAGLPDAVELVLAAAS
jgi:UDP:flavonoid glycosyltransferase YjiC (YdhE family)